LGQGTRSQETGSIIKHFSNEVKHPQTEGREFRAKKIDLKKENSESV